MAKFVSYPQAVSKARAGLQIGFLVGEDGPVGLGANTEPTQGELLLAVLSEHSLFSDEEELENSWVSGGVSALAAYSEEYGCWRTWVVTWSVHFESGLAASFVSQDSEKLAYSESEEGPMQPELAALLNASRWRALG